jgi:hypothetical protein
MSLNGYDTGHEQSAALLADGDVHGLCNGDGAHLDEITDRLRRLIDCGFRFAHPRDVQGSLVAIVGARAHHGVIDIVQLFSETDADAARVPGDEPDILLPRTVLWRITGPARTVLDRALALPDPVTDEGKVHRRANGYWMPTQPGRATWLPAPAWGSAS